jgi:hypothetical protein
MLALQVLLLDAPAPSPAMVRAINLESLTVPQAQHLAGQRLRFSIALDSTAAELDGQQEKRMPGLMYS